MDRLLKSGLSVSNLWEFLLENLGLIGNVQFFKVLIFFDTRGRCQFFHFLISFDLCTNFCALIITHYFVRTIP